MLGKKFQGIGGQKYLEERAHVQMTGCNATHNVLKFFLKEYFRQFCSLVRKSASIRGQSKTMLGRAKFLF